MTASPNNIATSFNGMSSSDVTQCLKDATNIPSKAYILAKNPDVVQALKYRWHDADRRPIAVGLLSTDGFINALPEGTEEQILTLLEDQSFDAFEESALNAEQRAAILAADMAIWRLSDYKDGGKRIAALLTDEQKVSNKASNILLADGAVWGLVQAGQGEIVMSLIENAPTSEHQRAILNAKWARGALETAGFNDRIDVIQSGINHDFPALHA